MRLLQEKGFDPKVERLNPNPSFTLFLLCVFVCERQINLTKERLFLFCATKHEQRREQQNGDQKVRRVACLKPCSFVTNDFFSRRDLATNRMFAHDAEHETLDEIKNWMARQCNLSPVLRCFHLLRTRTGLWLVEPILVISALPAVFRLDSFFCLEAARFWHMQGVEFTSSCESTRYLKQWFQCSI